MLTKLHITDAICWVTLEGAMKRSRIATILFGVLWITLAILGSAGLTAYANQAGEKAASPRHWPRGVSVTRAKSQPTLLVFLHPECSCSHATLRELDHLLARPSHSFATTAVFIRPSGWTDRQLKGELWDYAVKIPHVKLAIDETGNDAKAFGARTSGHTVLYDASGKLLFTGGITAARGHEGDNLGESSVEEFLATGKADAKTTAVFGCSLVGGFPLEKFTRAIARLL